MFNSCPLHDNSYLTEPDPITQELPAQSQLQDDFMRRNFIASQLTRSTLGTAPRAVHFRTQIRLSSGKSYKHYSELDITCIGGCIPVPQQLPNMSVHIFMFKNSRKSPLLGGDFSITIRI